MKKYIYLILILAFIFRLFLIPVAHHGDLNNNISWGQELLVRGPNGFYGSSDANDWPYSAPNQPPLYLLLFATTTYIANFTDSSIRYANDAVGIFPSRLVWFWETNGMDILTKMPGILADLGIGFLIYRYFTKRNRESIGVKLGLLWLLNPITWYSSGIWGQTDTLINLIGLLGIFALLHRRLVLFTFLFTVGFLFKGSLGIFVPVLLVLLLKQRYALRELASAASACMATIFVTSVWFHPYLDFPMWIVDLYMTRILPGEIGYLTANAFNFWWLVDNGRVLDSTLYLGISARVWGLIITLFGMIGVGYWLARGKITDKKVFYSLALVSLISFIFMTRIHERYLFPFFPYATLLIGFIPSTVYMYLILSFVHLLNLYHLFWAPNIGAVENLYTDPTFMNILAVFHIFFLVYYFSNLRSLNTGERSKIK